MEDHLQELAHLAELSPDDPWAWMNLAHALIDGGAVFPGRHVLQRAFGVARDDERAWLEIGRTYERLNAPEDAVDAYRQVCRLAPGVGGGEVSLSNLFLRDGEGEAAEMEARNGLRHVPESPTLHAALARALRAQERFEPAIEHAEVALRGRDPEPEDLRLAADLYGRVGDTARQLDALEALRQREPDDAELAIDFGLAALDSNQPERAKAAFAEANAHGPFDAATALKLASGLRRTGSLEEALVVLTGAQQREPSSGNVALQRGLVLEQLGRHVDALSEFARALSASPPPPRCSFYFGRALARADRLDESATHLLRAASDDPTDEAVRRVLADVLAKLDGGATRVPTANNLDVDLKIFSLPELIEFLAQQKATGTLELTTPEGTATIAMAHGALAFVASTTTPPLFQLLQTRGITTAQLESVGLGDETPPLEVVQRVAKAGFLVPSALEAALSRFVVRGLMQVLRFEEGRATFRGETTSVDIDREVLVSARAAMFDAIRRLDERKSGRSKSSGGRGYSTS